LRQVVGVDEQADELEVVEMRRAKRNSSGHLGERPQGLGGFIGHASQAGPSDLAEPGGLGSSAAEAAEAENDRTGKYLRKRLLV